MNFDHKRSLATRLQNYSPNKNMPTKAKAKTESAPPGLFLVPAPVKMIGVVVGDAYAGDVFEPFPALGLNPLEYVDGAAALAELLSGEVAPEPGYTIPALLQAASPADGLDSTQGE